MTFQTSKIQIMFPKKHSQTENWNLALHFPLTAQKLHRPKILQNPKILWNYGKPLTNFPKILGSLKFFRLLRSLGPVHDCALFFQAFPCKPYSRKNLQCKFLTAIAPTCLKNSFECSGPNSKFETKKSV